MSIRTEACQISGKVSRSSLYWKIKPPKGYMWSGWTLTKIQATTRPDHVWPEVQSKIGKAAQNREKTGMGRKENQSSTLLEDWEEFTSSIQMPKSFKKFSITQGENWKDLWQQPCRAKRKLGLATREVLLRKLHIRRFQNSVRLYCGISWNYEAASRIFAVQNTKITLQEKVLLRWPITICSQVFFCLKRWKFGCKSCSGQGMEKARDDPSIEFGKS